jgi:hypothetical protein
MMIFKIETAYVSNLIHPCNKLFSSGMGEIGER